MIRRPTQQLEHMEQANVRPGYKARRPMEVIEAEMEDEQKRRKK